MRTPYIVDYGGFGTAAAFTVRGRVLAEAPPVPEEVDASAWSNLLALYRQLESDELTGVVVRASFQGDLWEGVTDSEGYFELTIEPRQPPATEAGWHEVALACVDAATGETLGAAVTTRVLTPPPTCRFGVISDIDDTILWSYATSPLRAAMELLLKNVHERQVIAGVPEFYRALHAGARGDEQNPFFYVSLSPWNLHTFLAAFMEQAGLPPGPLLLRDLGLQTLRDLGQSGQKLPIIRQVLDTYPALPFVLLGDTGQHDPETYLEVVRTHPGRIRTVYLRDVTGPERRAEVQALGMLMRWAGTPWVLAAETEAFVEEARRRGMVGG